MANQQRTTRRRLNLYIFSALLLLIVWYQRLYGSLSKSSFSQIATTNPALANRPQSQSLDLAHDLSSARAPFISWPLRRLCDEQVQTAIIPGLVFICDNNSGGPGNIRNYILTCLRYAIAAGATGMQMPRIRMRSEKDIVDLFLGGYRPFGYMFSEERFVDGLREACPHLQIFLTGGEEGKEKEAMGLENIPGVLAKSEREGLPPDKLIYMIKPKDYGGDRSGSDQRDVNRYTDRFGDIFRDSLLDREKKFDLPPTSWENPMLVRLSWGVLWDWPVFRDGPEFAATFGGLLTIREDILQLADSIVRIMRNNAISRSATNSLNDDPGMGGTRQSEDVRPKDAFLGIHLRTEQDALTQWPTYENQSIGYFQEARRRGFEGGTAYLASGSAEETRKFAEDARSQLDLDVKSKYDLLQTKDLAKLDEMSWDQQALVDFAVLLQADYFLGVSPSSFSINIALKRRLQLEGLHTRPWQIGSSDGRSWLVGSYRKYWDDWLFMFDGMWP
ncbi:hypothetical protein F5Y16DRAFT_355042 [Xylariaceae sp. FL0255]|nr:hypothetical protein F5Y16DRAFT_355042 [Xylariaceae sp. FL0255]